MSRLDQLRLAAKQAAIRAFLIAKAQAEARKAALQEIAKKSAQKVKTTYEQVAAEYKAKSKTDSTQYQQVQQPATPLQQIETGTAPRLPVSLRQAENIPLNVDQNKPSEAESNSESNSSSSVGSVTENLVSDVIQGFNSDGDRMVFELRSENKAEVVFGLKNQYGYRVEVEQVGGNHPNGSAGNELPQYEVTFDKKLLGAVTGTFPIPGVDPKGELGLRTADSVTMSFDSPEEASRAVNILGRVAAEETVRDTASAVPPTGSSMVDSSETSSSVTNNPVHDAPDAHESSGPLGIPQPGSLVVNYAADVVGPSDSDLAFLQDNMVRYSSELDNRARVAIQESFANLGLEGRLDAVRGVRRTVELPQGDEPGTVTYTLISERQLSSKQHATLGLQLADQFEGGLRATNRSTHANAAVELDLTWTFDSEESGSVIGGQSYPEFDSLSNSTYRAPEQAELRMTVGYQHQALIDPTRTDWTQNTITCQINNPTSTSNEIFHDILDADLNQAIQAVRQNSQLTLRQETIQRDGIDIQPELALKAFDFIQFKSSLILEAGTDDVYGRREVVYGQDLKLPQPPSISADLGKVVDETKNQKLDEILEEYQVVEEDLVTFKPDGGIGTPSWTPFIGEKTFFEYDIPFIDGREVTESEAELLDKLSNQDLLKLNDLKEKAENTPNEFYSSLGDDDGHFDAFRHIYVNALISSEFGEDYAKALMTAHEARPDNPASREAMDLYNNEIGRRIASEHPDASDEELAQYVYETIESGEALVIAQGGNLAWSDQVVDGNAGSAEKGPVLDGQIEANAEAEPNESYG